MNTITHDHHSCLRGRPCHRRIVQGLLLAVLLISAVTAIADGFVIEPYVTRVNSESAVVIWVEPQTAVPGSIMFEPAAGGETRAVSASVSQPPFLNRRVEGGKTDLTRHLGRLTGLEPFTTYRYRVTATDGESIREGTFTTAPPEGHATPFTFSVMSDSHGSHHPAAAAVANDEPLFVVLTGDFIGGRGHDWGNWVSYFSSARTYLKHSVIWPVVGGHDIRPDDNYRALFGLDDPQGDFPHPEASYYAFTFGNLLYISLDQYADDRETQLEWLEAVLQNHNAEWIFASFHSPVFAVGSRGGMQGHADFVPLFEAYGVDIVIYGHNHIYERMLPIGPENKKPVHYICTNAGGNFRVVRPSPIVAGGIGRRALCHATFTIHGNQLDMVVKQTDGTVIDRLELVKTDGRYPSEIMDRAIDAGRARQIAHVYSAGGEPGGMYDREDLGIDFKTLPQAGKPVIGLLDVRHFPAGSRLHVMPDPEDNPWAVTEQTLAIESDTLELELTGPADLVYAKDGFDPALRLVLNLELDGRWFEPAPVVPSPGPATLEMLSPEAISRQLGLERVTYSSDLLPATRLDLPDEPHFGGGFRSRGPHTYYTWVDEAPATIDLRVMGGGISAARYRRRGAYEIELYYPADPKTGEKVDGAQVERTGETQSITLTTHHAGAHRIFYNDGRDRTNIDWEPGLPMTVKVAPDDYPAYPSEHQSWPDMVFYVPPGTETVEGHAWARHGTIRDSDGEEVFSLDRYEGFFQIPVPEGQDGTFWQLRGFSGRFYFMNIPPYIARGATELLLPRDVIEEP